MAGENLDCRSPIPIHKIRQVHSAQGENEHECDAASTQQPHVPHTLRFAAASSPPPLRRRLFAAASSPLPLRPCGFAPAASLRRRYPSVVTLAPPSSARCFNPLLVASLPPHPFVAGEGLPRPVLPHQHFETQRGPCRYPEHHEEKHPRSFEQGGEA